MEVKKHRRLTLKERVIIQTLLEEKKTKAYIAKILNREAYLLKLAIDEEQFYKQNINESTYFIHENVLQIYTGEKLFIEIEYDNDKFNESS